MNETQSNHLKNDNRKYEQKYKKKEQRYRMNAI